MTLDELRRTLSPTRWALIGIALLVAASTLWWVLTEPGRANARASRAKADATFADTAAGSARDASRTVAAAGDREAEINRQTQEGENAIRQAPARDRTAVAVAQLCLRASARDDPQCIRLRQSRSGGVE